MSLKEIEPLVGTGVMYLDPLESKRQKIDMMDKWTDVLGKQKELIGIRLSQLSLWVPRLEHIRLKLLHPVPVECILPGERIQWSFSFSGYSSFSPYGRCIQCSPAEKL